MSSHQKNPDFAELLLKWYDRNARVLPWRIAPDQSKIGVLPDPYHVWLSEVMLQQTQVATVKDYYLKFLRLWPTVDDLGRAETEDVMKAWAGLGYYSRARNLKKCAETITFDCEGRFPESFDELKKLPGIGDYTAAAISSIAFQKPVAVVDGNIERVITRQYRLDKPVVQIKPAIKELVTKLLPKERPGDFAQAMMDLGATLCSPKNPACSLCPVAASCQAYAHGDAERFPVKLAKATKPVRKGAAFVIQNAKGEVLLCKRADNGLLGGMSEIPGTVWTARIDGAVGKESLPFDGDWKLRGIARHTFTHFHLELDIWHIEAVDIAQIGSGWWSPFNNLKTEALPTVMKKAISVALPNAFKG